MNAAALIDTGAILALLDRDDEWHRACREAFKAVQFPLLTTEAVLTEAFHLTARDLGDIRGLWQMLRSGSVKMATIADAELPEIHLLMTKYGDHPMDFADATLVYLAARESLSLILTIDHDDFETYRIGGTRRFTILPRRNQRSL
jgi:predicted nucleic acid-binding protein